jgi:hypothetical protein
MLKLRLFFLVMFTTLLNVQADTTDIYEFLYTGSQGEESFTLNTEKTKTEIQRVLVDRICYRNEVRRVCGNRPPMCRRVCDARGFCRQVCNGGGYGCWNQVVRVSYPCQVWEEIPVQVFDYHVQTNIAVKLVTYNSSAPLAEKLSFVVKGDALNFDIKSSKNYAILLKDIKKEERRIGDTKVINLSYELELDNIFDLKSVMKKGISSVKLNDNVVSYKLTGNFEPALYAQSLKLYQYRRAGSDYILYNDSVTPELIIDRDGNPLFNLDLKTLGVEVPFSKRVIIEINYNNQGLEILNKKEIESFLSTSVNYIFR